MPERVLVDRWKLESRKKVFEHPFVIIVADTLSRDGVTRPYFFIDSPVDSVAIVAITGEKELVLTRQYRHPMGRIFIDLPAGRAEVGEDPWEAAVRELAEETGYRAERMIPLGKLSPFPGSLRVTQHVFYATGLTRGTQNLDAGEELEVLHRPFDEVYQEVVQGEYLDGALQYSVLMARARGLV